MKNMRRKDREITDTAELEAIINRAVVCRLGLSGPDGPYIVPVNFGYSDGSFYIHSASEGQKLDIIRRNNRVCIEIDEASEIRKADIPCNWGFSYSSIIAYGTAEIITSEPDKRTALGIIMDQYSDEKQSWEFSERSVNTVVIIKVTVESMSGKSSK